MEKRGISTVEIRILRDFSQIKQGMHEQLEEHLSAINENTAEIQALFDLFYALDNKIDSLARQFMQFQHQHHAEPHRNISLTLNERQLFLTMYTEEEPLSYPELAVKAALPETLVREYISIMSQKGIPIQKSCAFKQTFVQLDPSFKERQAKENIINLSLEAFMH